MTALPRPILLVGGGRMGGALAAGWRARGLKAADLIVVEPDPARHSTFPGSRIAAAPDELAADLAPAVIVFAVKPQVMDSILPAYRSWARASRLVLSIAAGKPIATFEAAFGADCPIVRAMPNTPAQIGRGITVLCAGGACDDAARGYAEALMAAVGEVAWIDDEELMHAVTALSGSGPAYVFNLVEAMAWGGERLGLPADLAMRLARATVAGAGELLYRSSEPAKALRAAVTSPGGTTEAALRVLMAEGGLRDLLAQAMQAAEHRSRELASA